MDIVVAEEPGDVMAGASETPQRIERAWPATGMEKDPHRLYCPRFSLHFNRNRISISKENDRAEMVAIFPVLVFTDSFGSAS
jgi:hypothetical protein